LRLYRLEFRMRLIYLPLLCLLGALSLASGPLARADAQSSPGSGSPGAGSYGPAINRVLVRKAEHRMYLLAGDEVVRSYHVSLGLAPFGHKERSGDFRTPEGVYRLGKRNRRSDYFLSIQISYPNRADIEKARRNRWDVGGSIMIHGLPNQLKREPEYYVTEDWTNGCIALANADMLEIWSLVTNNTPIEIVP
jgi:murein L,D-transpeptidase YafK